MTRGPDGRLILDPSERVSPEIAARFVAWWQSVRLRALWRFR